jgi:hypothetical protein
MVIGRIHRYGKQICLNAILSTTNLTRTGAGANVGLREEKPATTKRQFKCSHVADGTALVRPRTSLTAYACYEQGMVRCLVDTVVCFVRYV